jgi:diacylglycerol kinase family enzyme
MKHLFIVNPYARKLIGRVDEIVEDIRVFFFNNHQQIKYDIHITRWRRDAEGFVRRYVNGAPEIVRVYAVGGTGTFFEIINGVAGLPNVQVTIFPFGIHNSLLHYFGEAMVERFQTLSNLVFSRCISLDLIRCCNKFGVGFCLIGVEAMSVQMGRSIINKLKFLSSEGRWTKAIYFCSGLYYMSQKKTIRHYRIDIDGKSFGGEYLNILIANQPYYGSKMSPALDARPDDGFLDIYIAKPVPFHQRIGFVSDYMNGQYTKWFPFITHYRGRRVSITSDVVIPICFDGEMFFDTVIQAEVVPHAMNFTGPTGIDTAGREI